jgi:hypothetical protein
MIPGHGLRITTMKFMELKINNMKPTLKDQSILILQSIRELREIYGPVPDYRIKRQLVNTRKYCRTVNMNNNK